MPPSKPAARSSWSRARSWACGNEVGFGRRHRAGTGVLLDLCAMLKSLFAALTILHLLSTDLITCTDVTLNRYTSPSFLVPSWFITQQCQPTLELDTILQLFTAAIVMNQLTFVATSLITHANPCNILRHARTRSALGYSLALCSFLFGFCKIGLIVAIAATSSVAYPCLAPAPQFTDGGLECAGVQILAPQALTQAPTDMSIDCSSSCSFTVPPEVFILSMTFVLTFGYSLFMCDQLMHRRPDEEALEAAEDERRRGALLEAHAMDELDQEQQAAEEHYQHDPELVAQPKSNSALGVALLSTPQQTYSRSRPAASAPSAPGSAASAAGFVEMDSGFDAEMSLSNYNGGVSNLELSQRDSMQPSASTSFAAGGGAVRRSAPSSRAGPTTGDASDSKYVAVAPVRSRTTLDMVALDPLTFRALSVASTLSSQDLLLAQIESDLRKALSHRLRNRDLVYRLIRDIATLLKFMLTLASLSLLLYNVGGSIIDCAVSPNLQADAAAGVSPSIILQSCAPQLSSTTSAFLFAVIGVVVASLFIVIIIVEKRVLLPAQARWLSLFLLSAVTLLLAAQLALMVDIESTPLDFPCSHSYTFENQSLTELSVCRHWNVTLGHQFTVDCAQRCEVALGSSTYLLFSSLILSLVYLASLVMRYQDLARITTATRKRMDTEMARLLAPPPKAGETQRKIDPKQVVQAILAKY